MYERWSWLKSTNVDEFIIFTTRRMANVPKKWPRPINYFAVLKEITLHGQKGRWQGGGNFWFRWIYSWRVPAEGKTRYKYTGTFIITSSISLHILLANHQSTFSNSIHSIKQLGVHALLSYNCFNGLDLRGLRLMARQHRAYRWKVLKTEQRKLRARKITEVKNGQKSICSSLCHKINASGKSDDAKWALQMVSGTRMFYCWWWTWWPWMSGNTEESYC